MGPSNSSSIVGRFCKNCIENNTTIMLILSMNLSVSLWLSYILVLSLTSCVIRLGQDGDSYLSKDRQEAYGFGNHSQKT